MANLINLETVTKSFGLKTLLDNVSLGVQTGDRIGIVGVNGDGKSTLLRMLAGRLEPDSGRVTRRGGVTLAMLDQAAADLQAEIDVA